MIAASKAIIQTMKRAGLCCLGLIGSAMTSKSGEFPDDAPIVAGGALFFGGPVTGDFMARRGPVSGRRGVTALVGFTGGTYAKPPFPLMLSPDDTMGRGSRGVIKGAMLERVVVERMAPVEVPAEFTA